MINTNQSIKDLNAFIGTVKIHSPDKIISSLVDEKVVINHSVAKLIVKGNHSLIADHINNFD